MTIPFRENPWREVVRVVLISAYLASALPQAAVAQDQAGAAALWSVRPYRVAVVVFHDAAPCWSDAALQAVVDGTIAGGRSLWGEAVRLQVMLAPPRVRDWIEGPITDDQLLGVVSLMSNNPYAGTSAVPSQINLPLEYDKVILLSLSKQSAGWAAFAKEYDTFLTASGPLVRRFGNSTADIQPAHAALFSAFCPVVEVHRNEEGKFNFLPRAVDLDWGSADSVPLGRPSVMRLSLPSAVIADDESAWQDEVFLQYDPATDATHVYAARQDPLQYLEPNQRFYATVVSPTLQPMSVEFAGGEYSAAGWELAVRPIENGSATLLELQDDGSYRAPASRATVQFLELRAHGRALAQWPLVIGSSPVIRLDANRFLPLAEVAALADAETPLVLAAVLEYEQRLAEIRSAQANGNADSVTELLQQAEPWRAERETQLLLRLQLDEERWANAADSVVRAANERLETLRAEVRQSLAAERLSELTPPPAPSAEPVVPNEGAPAASGALVPPAEGATPPAGLPAALPVPSGATPPAAPMMP